MRRLHAVDGDVAEHVDGVGLCTLAEVGNDIQARRNHHIPYDALIHGRSVAVQKERDRERTTRSSQEKEDNPCQRSNQKGRKYTRSKLGVTIPLLPYLDWEMTVKSNFS